MRIAIVSWMLLLAALPLAAADQVAFQHDGREHEVSGRLLLKAQDGGLLLLASDGRLWAIPPEETPRLTQDETPFKPLPRDELAKKLLAELPPGFDTLATAHYLICYDTSKPYAQWCGSLFERLHGAFVNFWTRKGFELHESEFPLVAILFADRNAYLKFTRSDLGPAGESIVAYYNLMSNRMTLYDLTGIETSGQALPRSTAQQINQILNQPRARDAVATVVHEAAHQIAFNCGLQTRLSDCPLWVSEGIAMYFETPDLRSTKGWGGIGGVNYPRLQHFGRSLSRRPPDALLALIQSDKPFHDAQTAVREDAYAEAWALTYFLIRQHPKEYVKYMQGLSRKTPLLTDTPEERKAEFEKAFGPLNRLDAEFLRAMNRVR